MAHSDFSMRKLLSFFGAGVLVLVAFVAIALGGNLISNGQFFYGGMSCLAGGACGTLAVKLYQNYQKWANEHNNNKPNYTR